MTLSFKDRIQRLAETELNIDRIKNIEKWFGSDNKQPLFQPGRALVGEGVLIKECRKKPKQRYFFLFNDILVYGTCVINKIKYINQHIIALKNLQIKSIPDSTTNPKLKNGWLIMSPKKTFSVYATTSREKIEWMTHISNCIEKLPDNQRNNYLNKEETGTAPAPQWIPDKDADTCMRCKSAKFTVVNRRHHCRNCGYVICGDCSKNRFLLLSQSDDPLRVCNTCYKALSGSGSVAESRSDIANTDTSDESDTDESQLSMQKSEIDENDSHFYSKY